MYAAVLTAPYPSVLQEIKSNPMPVTALPDLPRPPLSFHLDPEIQVLLNHNIPVLGVAFDLAGLSHEVHFPNKPGSGTTTNFETGPGPRG